MPTATPICQAVWDLFADGQAITIADAAKVDVPINTARAFFSEWKRIGAIGFSHAEGKTRFYKRLSDSDIAPREELRPASEDDDRGLRDRAWALFRARECVTVRDLEEIGVFRKSAEGFIASWLSDGAIRFDHREGRRKFFRCVIDADKAPMTSRPGNKLAPRERMALNLWRSARGLKVFTPRDLAAHAATSDMVVEVADATRFARMLLRGGYLRVLRKARPSEEIEARYRLVRDTGPKAPIEKRVRAVWDENEARYVHIPETAS